MDSENSNEYGDNVHKTFLQLPKELAGVEFGSREAMEEALHEFAATQGYDYVTKSSYRQRNGKSTIFYECDRGGSYRNRLGLTEERRKRKISTALVNCPFRLKRSRKIFSGTSV